MLSKLQFHWKESLKKCTTYEEQKGEEGIFGQMFILALSSLAVFCLQNCASDFNLFWSGDQRLFHFTDIMNISSNILAKNQNFKKLRHGFMDTRTMIAMALISSCRWKTLVPFLLMKENTWERIFNTDNELSQNCTEKQIMVLKTTLNWLFNDICYLVVGGFDWKISIFQQKVVRGLLTVLYCHE